MSADRGHEAAAWRARVEARLADPTKIRIVSDGTIGGTRVFIAETGQEIGGLVTAVTWTLDCKKDRAARVTLELFGPHVEVDVIGEGEETS